MNAAEFAAAASAVVTATARPACVQLDVAMTAIPAGKGLLSTGLRPGQPGYRELLSAANGILADAFAALRDRHGFTDITAAGLVTDETSGPDVTDLLLDELSRITRPLQSLRKAG